jgi:exodeoxyribonuclease VII small subunit
MTGKTDSGKKFETALEDLEQVVEQLESGELSLEDSLAAFEKGVGLVKYCNQKLNEVERKIELLVKDKDGRLQLKSFEDVPAPESADR